VAGRTARRIRAAAVTVRIRFMERARLPKFHPESGI
jgi:hypothetical protein